ncbi:hypothetical protein BLNAU_9235 [Blattamonas nauphoetae]|uniref:Uncharacterized protein n=1 Tax=Blattamonas nauphoetae TaxID=2049346 RepID=A0ABQ9XWN6_9EUKA|nr:hypothetical protein BLNAU_9235 [Blattamonas nauphoetae]
MFSLKQQPILRCLINISSIDSYSDGIVMSGSLDFLIQLSQILDADISEETWWLLANCAYSNSDISDFFLKNGIIPAISNFISAVLQPNICTPVPHHQHLSLTDFESLLPTDSSPPAFVHLLVCLLVSQNQDIVSLAVNLIYNLVSTHTPFLDCFLTQSAPFTDTQNPSPFVHILCALLPDFFPQLIEAFQSLDLFQVFLIRRRSFSDESPSTEQVRAEQKLLTSIDQDIHSACSIITSTLRLIVTISALSDDFFGDAVQTSMQTHVTNWIVRLNQLLPPNPHPSQAPTLADSILEALRNGQAESIPPQFRIFESILLYDSTHAPLDHSKLSVLQDKDKVDLISSFIHETNEGLVAFAQLCMKDVFCAFSNFIIGTPDIRRRLLIDTFPQYPDGSGLFLFILEVCPSSTLVSLKDLIYLIYTLSLTPDTVLLVIRHSLLPAAIRQLQTVVSRASIPTHYAQTMQFIFGSVKQCLIAAEREFKEAVMAGTSSDREGFTEDGRFIGNQFLLQIKEGGMKEEVEKLVKSPGFNNLCTEILELIKTASGSSALFS